MPSALLLFEGGIFTGNTCVSSPEKAGSANGLGNPINVRSLFKLDIEYRCRLPSTPLTSGVLDRRGSAGRFGHQHFVLEGRFDEAVATAQVMLAAARAVPHLEPGAYSLAEIPLSALWGEEAGKAEGNWL